MENVEKVENIGGGGGAPGERADVEARPAPDDAGATKKRRIVLTSAMQRTLLFLLGAAVVGASFWWLQFSTQSICCGDFDAYYHFRWSQMLLDGLRTGNFPPQFTSLPLTTLNPQDYVDHHFLFHLLQSPFTQFGDLRFNAKMATWLFACLAVLSCYWMVLRYRLRYPLVWLVALLGCSAPFLYRMQMGKAMSVSIVLLVAGICLLFERRYVWLLPLTFIFALTYDMFALLGVAAFFWAAVILWSERRIEWRPIVYVGVGACLGFVINPYFPHNLQLFYEHLVIKVTPSDFTTAVGNEWYPYNTWEFLGNCLVATAATVLGYLAFNGSDRKATQRSLFFLLFSTLLLVANMRWRRFSEYWPPFAVLFAAFTFETLFERARAAATPALPGEVLDDLRPLLDGRERPEVAEEREAARTREWLFAASLVVLLAAPAVWNFHVTAKDIAGMAGPDHYRGGMEWISKNVPKGELVYNADWDDFPKLFFYEPDRPFVSGLDPTYLLDQNRELQKQHERIGTAQEEDPGPVIRDNFCLGEGEARRCARYVFMDHDHEGFYNNALDSGWFDEVYTDDDCIILRLREEKGPPVEEPEDNQEADTGR